jgi:5-methylcytosine-specific restriction endonuclease McrA
MIVRMFEPGRSEGPHHFEPDHCASCLTLLPPSNRSLFCSEQCKQTADLVRYWRRIIRDRRIHQPDVEDALRTRIAHVLAGGYRENARRLSKATRDEVWSRDDGLCRSCGKPGEEVDHIAGDSSELSNLQLLCGACHHAKTWVRMRPATPDEQETIAKLYRERVLPDQPILLADDEIRWRNEWQRLKRERHEGLLEDMADMGYERSDYPDLSWEAFVDLAVEDEADDAIATEPGDYDGGYGPGSYFAHAMAKAD